MPKTAKIIIIRHAEKPPEDGTPSGVTVKGESDEDSLTVRGWQRAGALASFFAPAVGAFRDVELARPDFLFASDSKSQRPLETIAPLAEVLGITPKTFKKEDLPSLVDAAKTCGGSALICWQHELIPAIANLLLGNDPTVPQKWPGARFDLVWIFNLQSSGTFAFTQVAQQLLSGDSSEPI